MTKDRVWKAVRAKWRRKRIDSWVVREKWPGEHGGVKVVKRDIENFKREVASTPLQLVESPDNKFVSFLRAAGRPVREEVNTSLLKQLKQRHDHTFVVDSSLACMFDSIEMQKLPRTPHMKTFADLIQSVKLGAPPIARNEYEALHLRSSIPVGTLAPEDIQLSEDMAETMIWLFRRSPKALWMAAKKQHKLRLRDYMYVVQSAMLYPKSTILTNDRDFYIFDSMMEEIEQFIYQKHGSHRFVNLRSVAFVNVMDELGLDVNVANGYFWPRKEMRALDGIRRQAKKASAAPE